MSALSIQPTYPIFTDIDGQPLEAGYVWLGTANLDPQTNPINVYWDAALTLPAAQPIRTLAGYPANSGTPARLYVNSDYSIRVMNKNGSAVYSAPAATERYSGSVISTIDASQVEFTQQGIDAVPITLQDILEGGPVTPEQFGAIGDGVTDDTAAVQAAINTNKSIDFGDKEYLVGPLSVPSSASGAVYSGAGYYHYSKLYKTRLTARDVGQTHIFKFASGCSNIVIQNMRLDGVDKCAKVIDGEFCPFLTLDNLGIYGATEWGIYSLQGLMRVSNLFVNCRNATGGGAHIYSDSSIENSEFTGGEVPLRLAAGGDRLSNVWVNSGKTSCLDLIPLNTATNHSTTNISNLYIGETLGGGVEKPIIRMLGNAVKKVDYVTITGMHIVCADAPDKINFGIEINKATNIIISASNCEGNVVPTASRHMTHFIKASEVNGLLVTGCVVKSVVKNPIVLNADCFDVSIVGNQFVEYATTIGAGTEGAGIINTSATNYGVIADNSFDTASASTVPYFMEGGSATRWNVSNNFLRYNNTLQWNSSSGYDSGGWRRLGAQPRLPGTVTGFAIYDPPSLPDGSGATTTLTVTGAALGDGVDSVSFTNDLQGITVTGWVSAADTVSVRFQNETGGVVDLASGTLRVRVTKFV